MSDLEDTEKRIDFEDRLRADIRRGIADGYTTNTWFQMIDGYIADAVSDARERFIWQACEAVRSWTERVIVNGKILRQDALNAVKSLRKPR